MVGQPSPSQLTRSFEICIIPALVSIRYESSSCDTSVPAIDPDPPIKRSVTSCANTVLGPIAAAKANAEANAIRDLCVICSDLSNLHAVWVLLGCKRAKSVSFVHWEKQKFPSIMSQN
jgi:hypothetical protein